MGSSICRNCQIQTEESDNSQSLPIKQISFEQFEQEQPIEQKQPMEIQAPQPETDASKNEQCSQLKGILKHQNHDHSHSDQENQVKNSINSKRKVKFRKPSKQFQRD